MLMHSFLSLLVCRLVGVGVLILVLPAYLVQGAAGGVGSHGAAFWKSPRYISGCNIVIYNKKYIFCLCPCFWYRNPKTIGISQVMRVTPLRFFGKVNEVTLGKYPGNLGMRRCHQGSQACA